MPKSRKEESHKTNLYIGKSISKNLLTPCRRVGLPKKRKSSANNSINQSLSHIESILDKSYDETVSTAAISPELKENNQQELVFHDDLNKKTREEEVQCMEINNDQNPQLEEIVENNQDPKEDNNLDIVDVQDDTTIQTKRKHRSDKNSRKESKTEKSENRPDKKKKKSQTVKVESSRTRSPILFDDDDVEDFVADDKLKMQRIKNMNTKSKSYDFKLLDTTKTNNNGNNRELRVKLRRIDSDPPPRVYSNKKLDNTEDYTRKPLKISDLNDDESFQVKKTNPIDLKESKILAPKNKEDSPELPNLEPVSSTKKTRKIKRSLSLKKTHSDEQNIDDDFENYPPPLLQINPDKIDELEREIAKKREILENLHQTEIYKRLHNVDELKDVTEMWKTACISAINDLLPQLKPYTGIDMETLLEKLNVPEHLIKLSTSGDLI